MGSAAPGEFDDDDWDVVFTMGQVGRWALLLLAVIYVCGPVADWLWNILQYIDPFQLPTTSR